MDRSKRTQCGFSMIELMMVCAIAVILTVMAVPLYQSNLQISNADSAAQLIAQELRLAKALAVSTNGPVLVKFDPSANAVSVAPATGSARGPFILPGKMMFLKAAAPLDTPDALGAKVLGVDKNTTITFLNNGTVATDESGATICSGTFFLQNENGDVITNRAVTLVGGTGKMRIWKYSPKNTSWY